MFDAFVSYSQRADADLANAVVRGLELFAKPWRKRRALRVFNDSSALGLTPALWPSIEEPLSQAQWLVVLLSPAATQSKWVDREIRHWLSIDDGERSDRILVVLTEGTTSWDDDLGDFDPESTAIPPALYGVFEHEPLHLDLRWTKQNGDSATNLALNNPRFRSAIAALAAPLHGLELSDIHGEAVQNEKRVRRFRNVAIAMLAALTVVAVISAGLAVSNARTAEQQTAIAEENEERAESETERAEAETERAEQEARVARAGQLGAASLAAQSDQNAAILAIEAALATPEPTSLASQALGAAVNRMSESMYVTTVSDSEPTQLIWAPDGRLLGASVEDFDTGLGWFFDGEEVVELPGPSKYRRWLPDGSGFFDYSEDDLSVYHNGQNRTLWTKNFTADDDKLDPDQLIVDPSGQYLSHDANGRLRIFSAETGALVVDLDLPLQTEDVDNLNRQSWWSPDGATLALGDQVGRLTLIDSVSGEVQIEKTFGSISRPSLSTGIQGVDWWLDGSEILVYFGPEAIILSTYRVNLENGTTTILDPSGFRADGGSLSPSGAMVSYSGDQGIRVADANDGRQLHQFDAEVEFILTTLEAPVWSPAGGIYAVSRRYSGDDGFEIRDALTGNEIAVGGENLGNQFQLVWSDDGTKLASVSANPRIGTSVAVFDLSRTFGGSLIRHPWAGIGRDPNQFNDASTWLDEEHFYLSDEDALWAIDLETGRHKETLAPRNENLRNSFLAPKSGFRRAGDVIAMWRGRKTDDDDPVLDIDVLAASDGRHLSRTTFPFAGALDDSRTVMNSAGSAIAATSAKGLRVWNVETGEVLGTIAVERDADWIWSDTNQLIVRDEDAVYVWSPSTDKRTDVLVIPDYESDFLNPIPWDYDPVDDRVAVGQKSGLVSIWDVKTKERLVSFLASETVTSLSLLPGELVTVATSDSLEIWDSKSGEFQQSLLPADPPSPRKLKRLQAGGDVLVALGLNLQIFQRQTLDELCDATNLGADRQELAVLAPTIDQFSCLDRPIPPLKRNLVAGYAPNHYQRLPATTMVQGNPLLGEVTIAAGPSTITMDLDERWTVTQTNVAGLWMSTDPYLYDQSWSQFNFAVCVPPMVNVLQLQDPDQSRAPEGRSVAITNYGLWRFEGPFDVDRALNLGSDDGVVEQLEDEMMLGQRAETFAYSFSRSQDDSCPFGDWAKLWLLEFNGVPWTVSVYADGSKAEFDEHVEAVERLFADAELGAIE